MPPSSSYVRCAVSSLGLQQTACDTMPVPCVMLHVKGIEGNKLIWHFIPLQSFTPGLCRQETGLCNIHVGNTF